MQTRRRYGCPCRGLSLVEILVVIAVMALLATLFIPAVGHKPTLQRIQRIQCFNNLKQIGLALNIYSNDHDERFPWRISTNLDSTNVRGSREFSNSTEVFRHFQAGSNELTNPKILVCPADKERRAATKFAELSNRNLSYLVGLDAG